mmetsp:Transcript_99749/g.157891  ORF Transcript_99749/g.157891 Transcript_99749/m.157891 type:complete len:375 (-) Transcript_99749:58-1182(-)
MAVATAMADSPQPSPTLDPILSPDNRPKRKLSGSDEEGQFLLEDSCASQLQTAIAETIGPDMKRRLKTSLNETLADLQREYPEEGEHLPALRKRANSELSDYVEMTSSRRGSRASSRFATPATAHPRGSPEVTLPDVPELPPPLSLPGFSDEEMLSHEGLFDHEQLMQAIYLSQGLDFSAIQSKAMQFLNAIGLRAHDLGVQNVDEFGRTLVNQCFYLSIAHAYLGNTAFSEEVSGLALRLKRAIEAAVLTQRPSWVGVNDDDTEAQAFADFLPIAMHAKDETGETPNLMAELVVCILDSVNGHVEVYIGPKYGELPEDDLELRQRNLILLWYTPGHYQCLVCDDAVGSKVMMTYDELKDVLTQNGVMYIETTE